MLIQALCNYYDILSAEGKVLPEGYSKVKIHYLISLTEEGTIDNIINVQREIAESKKEKVVKRLVPKEVEMPKGQKNLELKQIFQNIDLCTFLD